MDNQNKKKVVLITEDENSLLKALSTKLNQEGYDVLEASDGIEGLEQALSKHPDLILLDILMPRMNGMAMLDKLRLDPWGKNVHVIIMSNMDATNELLNKVVYDQPSYYLLKAGITLEEIIEKIQEVLN